MTTAAASFYRRTGKRVLDLAVASAAAVVLAPVMAGVAVAVRVGLGSPVLFKQERAGRGHRPFFIRKFRTMTDARGADGALLPDSVRLTGLGRFLRRSSLDELPELFNVIAGEMSLVGPRPLLVHYVPRYSAAQARRHEVRPGLTGWAAIHGRDYVRPDDVKTLAHPVLAHRLVLNSNTRLRGRATEEVLDEVVADVSVPIADTR